MQIVNIAKQASRLMASMGRGDANSTTEILEIEKTSELSPALLATLADLLNDQVQSIEERGAALAKAAALSVACGGPSSEIVYTEFTM